MNKALIVILFAVALDAIGIGLIFPILPTLIRDLSQATDIDIIYGVIISIYALMQFIFAPILGTLSDKYGRRTVLMLSLLGAAIDYVIMAFTPYLWVIFITRMIAGLTSANLSVATAYITDLSSESERAQRFGYLHAMFGIGFIVGPALGGILGEWWIRAPFWAAAFLNFMNFLLAVFILPESHKGSASKFEWSALNPVKPIMWALTVKPLIPYMLIFAAISLIGQIYGSAWALYSGEQFEWSPFMVGLSLTFFGLLHALVQAFLPGPVAARFGDVNASLIGFVSECVALVIFAFVTNGWFVFVIMPLFAIGGVGMPALQSLATRTVDGEHQGRLQGVLTSLGSLMAVFGPLMFTAIYAGSKSWFPGLLWLVAAIMYLVVIAMLLSLRRQNANVRDLAGGA